MKLCSPAHRRAAALAILSAQSSVDDSSSSLTSRSRSVSPLRSKPHNALLIGLSTGMFDANNPKVSIQKQSFSKNEITYLDEEWARTGIQLVWLVRGEGEYNLVDFVKEMALMVFNGNKICQAPGEQTEDKDGG